MKLSHIYAGRLRAGLKDAIDTRKLAEAWAALHPDGFKASKALSPEMSAFLGRARSAIIRVLQGILPGAWTEGWTLGQLSATAAAMLEPVDWGAWEPGDPDAASMVASGGLSQLLAEQGITIRSIAQSRIDELGDVLAEYLSSSAVGRVPVSEGPLEPEFSVGSLADELENVLDNPQRALMVAHTEIARAQSAAAQYVYGQMGIRDAEVSTAGDSRVCPRCADAEAAGAQPVGTYSLPLHPLCRCALMPVNTGRPMVPAVIS